MARPLTHVRLEDCFGEEHLVEIRTLPEDVQQAVQQQLEEKYGIKQAPIPQKEPGTIDEGEVREWLVGLPLTDTHPLPPLLDTALAWTRKAKCRAVLDKVDDFTPRVAALLPALLPRLPGEAPTDDEDSTLLRAAILLLRLLRNLCPNSPDNQHHIREAGVIETVLAFVRRMEERTRTLQAENQACKSHTEAMRMALQLLANFCTANSENQQYLWELLFPSALLYVLVLLRARVCKALTSSSVSAVSWFRDLITVSTDPQCTGHACMLLHNCTHAQSRWRAQVALSRPHMEALVAVLAHEGAGGGAYADAFEWAVLFLEAVLKDGLLSQIWANLASPTLPVQVVLLKILDGLTDRLAKVANGTTSTALMPLESYVFLALEFKRLRDDAERRSGDGKEEGKETTEEEVEENDTDARLQIEMEDLSDALLLLLQIFSAVALSDSAENARLKTALAEAETLGLLYQEAQTTSTGAGTRKWDDPPAMKRDLVRVVANMVHAHTANQDLVRTLEGIPLVLNCCQVDDLNPYMREWGILAVRNLCEDNEANQQIISSMQYVGVADNPELTRMGLKVVMEGGQFRLRKLDE
ncbi:spinocerbellar ataxia type 10 family protein [Acanthamoeba castellanii str. Neff]|uniref:Spinocerbellar ataxia type 10 family protein n=1 Tax=Acanthamoeba castellanii (strain ATCC 30010 / Neff) TaxID=1257118 RepID=L8HEB8_ACACF|nr:spinocerbellar ataxia type 10 family protein [Acanthamoeba castellanii str. Neff]ELR23884.1 spinocerbellar ataxia type 10 family protein [Acanthamoeba castellanii str. Neff]